MTRLATALPLLTFVLEAEDTLSPATNAALRLLHAAHPYLDDVKAQIVDAESAAHVVRGLAAWIEDARRAWISHPDYVANADFSGDVLDPPVVTVWHHAPGINGSEYSYAIVSLSSALSPGLETRMLRYLGRGIRLTAIGAVPPELHCSPYRETYYVGALGSRAQAYEARRLLKERLPRATHKVVNAARRLNRRPKWSFWQARLGRDEWESIRQTGAVRRRGLQPDWYRTQTKKELAIRHLREKYPAQIRRIERDIDAGDFWDCATGRVHPRDVPLKFRTRQLTLFD